MGSSDGSSSNLKKFTYTSRQLAVSPFSYLHVSSSSYSDSCSVGSKGNSKCTEGSNHHQRCSSESFLLEDQPSWLEELLSQPETLVHRCHRRSASDSYAYLGAAAAAEESFNIKEDSSSNNSISSSSIWDSPRFSHYHQNLNRDSFSAKSSSSDEKFSKAPKESNGTFSLSSDKQEKGDPHVQNVEGSTEKVNPAQAKSPASKADSKRAKQQSAHRSRVRKLKYIAELERTVQLLQAEGSEIHAELEFINQQNLILNMENRALRQRLDSLSQEQLIKHYEQEMLERELARLQTLYQLQSQQQMQMQQHQLQQPQQQHSKHRRNKSRDLLPQFANLSMNKKDSSCSRGSTSSSVHL